MTRAVAVLLLALALLSGRYGPAMALPGPERTTMPRAATGNVYESRGRWYARVTVAKGDRPSIPLPTCANEGAALARLAILADLAQKLRTAGQSKEITLGILERAGANDGRALDAVLRAAAAVCSGDAGPKRGAPAAVTFRDVAQRWVSGEIAAEHPDHVKVLKRPLNVHGYLKNHILPIVGDVPMVDFKREQAEAVMRSLPATLAVGTRRRVGLLMQRVLSLAVEPLRLIDVHPLPKGFLPRVLVRKAKGWLYPDEDARLLASPAVPLPWRILYGFLNREGMRSSEAARITWPDVDLERGIITLDENKTDDPRAWPLNPGVVRALHAWRTMGSAKHSTRGDQPVFSVIASTDGAHRFRQHLRAAGVTRAALFERSATRQPIRLHDTRATFVTLSLANGRSETWVMDRTGHRSSAMINLYRRAARTAAELGLGDLAPLDQAIPELGSPGAKGGGKGGAPSGEAGEDPTLKPNRSGSSAKIRKISEVVPGSLEGRPLRAARVIDLAHLAPAPTVLDEELSVPGRALLADVHPVGPRLPHRAAVIGVVGHAQHERPVTRGRVARVRAVGRVDDRVRPVPRELRGGVPRPVAVLRVPGRLKVTGRVGADGDVLPVSLVVRGRDEVVVRVKEPVLDVIAARDDHARLHMDIHAPRGGRRAVVYGIIRRLKKELFVRLARRIARAGVAAEPVLRLVGLRGEIALGGGSEREHLAVRAPRVIEAHMHPGQIPVHVRRPRPVDGGRREPHLGRILRGELILDGVIKAVGVDIHGQRVRVLTERRVLLGKGSARSERKG